MKILAIIGSSKNGNTSELVKYFERKIKEKDNVVFEYLYLSDYNIGFCTGCHNCIFIGEDKCLHYHIVKMIEDKIISSDVLILASPGYMFSVTGILKNFLDHVAYNCHRPKYFDKKAYLIACCTKWQEKSVFAPMETWLSGAGFRFVGKTYVDMLPFPLKEGELNKRRSKIDEATSRLHIELNQDEEVKPNFGSIIVFHVFRTLCKIAPQILKADYGYFNKINAYDKKARWYIQTKVSFFKHKLACYMERKIQKEITKLIDIDRMNSNEGNFRNRL